MSGSKNNPRRVSGGNKLMLNNLLNGGLKGGVKPNNFIAEIQNQGSDNQSVEAIETESVADSVKVESVADSVKVESVADSVKVESVADSVKVENVADSVKVENIETDTLPKANNSNPVLDVSSSNTSSEKQNAKQPKRNVYRFKSMVKVDASEERMARATIYMDYTLYQKLKAKLSQDIDRKIPFVGFTELMALACMHDVIDVEKITKELHKKGIIEIY